MVASFIGRIIDGIAGSQHAMPFAGVGPRVMSARTLGENPQALYAVLQRLYDNHDVYADANVAAITSGDQSIQGLRNPTFAACQFHAWTIWPGSLPDALPIETPERRNLRQQRSLSVAGQATQAEASARLEAAIQRGWQMSNWGRGKQQFARGLPKLGDQFIKVVGNRERGRVYFQLIHPLYVTDLDHDERGYLTFIRIDVPRQERGADGKPETVMYTEVWDKATGRYRLWQRKRALWTVGDLAQLGLPTEDRDIAEFGIDFIPIAHGMFLADDDEYVPSRGTAAITPALDKIIYGDALVTALHQRLTNHNIPDKVLEGVGLRGPDGESLPAPRLTNAAKVEVAGETFWSLPSGWTLRDTVAQLSYAEHLAVVEAHYHALAQTDLPQLTYYLVSEAGGADSGKALNYKLTPAKALAEEVRGNAEETLVQADMMLLTIGQNLGLEGFSKADIGTYANGDYQHSFAARDVLPMTMQDEVETLQARATIAQTISAGGGNIVGALEVAGFEHDDAVLAGGADLAAVTP